MTRKIKGLVTQRYAYSDPSKPQCFIKKDKVYEEVNLGVAMVNRILELKGAVVLGDLQPLDLDETGFIPDETDLDADDSEEENSEEENDSESEGSEDDSEEEDPSEEEPEAEQAEAKTRRKDKNSKRKGRNK